MILFGLYNTDSYSQVVDADETLPVDSGTGLITFTDIVDVSNTKDILFKNAQTWVAKTYGDYKAVIQFEDKEAGKMIIKGISPVKLRTASFLKYTLDIDVKEKKYRAIANSLESGYKFDDGHISYTPYGKFKPKSVVVKEYDLKIKLLEDRLKLANVLTRKTITKELEKEQEYQQAYLNAYVQDRILITDTVKQIFGSLKGAMSIKDDF